MTRTLAVALAAIGLGMSSATVLDAHHSYAAFDREHPVSIEGEITQVVFANPHVVLTVRAADADYTVEWLSMFQLTGRYHVLKDTLVAGDHVVVTARATRDPSEHRLSLVTDVRRPADGWSWSRPLMPVARP
jgi:uncharacterized protein DUF6152